MELSMGLLRWESSTSMQDRRVPLVPSSLKLDHPQPSDVVMISFRGQVQQVLDVLLKTCSRLGCELIALEPHQAESIAGQSVRINGYVVLATARGSPEQSSPGEAVGKIEVAEAGDARTFVTVYPRGRDGKRVPPRLAELLLGLATAFFTDLEDPEQAPRPSDA
jgi:hypothetical protein